MCVQFDTSRLQRNSSISTSSLPVTLPTLSRRGFISSFAAFTLTCASNPTQRPKRALNMSFPTTPKQPLHVYKHANASRKATVTRGRMIRQLTHRRDKHSRHRLFGVQKCPCRGRPGKSCGPSYPFTMGSSKLMPSVLGGESSPES